MQAEEIVSYWLDDVGSKRWFASDKALDGEIGDRFGRAWQSASDGLLEDWLADPLGALAYVILTDQFPRNMFRGDASAFATDARARKAAKLAVARGWDRGTEDRARMLHYMPLMHSENLSDQDRCVRLVLDRLPNSGPAGPSSYLLHARAHREVVRRFGRFPFRNEALSRNSTAKETAFLAEGGYGAVVRELGG